MKPACRRSGFERIEAVVSLTPETFDLLFNGRMGYRAQYYVSLNDGRRFNRLLINGLVDVLKRAYEMTKPEWDWATAEQSLRQKDSKLWPHLDDDAFKGQRELLVPPMWVANCKNYKSSRLGLRLAALNPPKVDLKGSWVSHTSDEPFLPEGKRCRDELLRCFGFT
jgi:hypothetical protein